MHPDISAFPAAEFYAGQLLDGEEVRRGTARAWHDHRVRAAACVEHAQLTPSVG